MDYLEDDEKMKKNAGMLAKRFSNKYNEKTAEK